MGTLTYGDAPSAAFSSILIAGVADLGFRPPTPGEIEPARELAGRMMGCKVAPARVVASMLAIQPASTLVRRDGGEVSAVAAVLLLNAAGGRALLANEFDGLSPQRRFLARSRATHCYYWGIAGATKSASAAVMEVFRRVRFELFPELTPAALAATPIGRHVAMTRLDMHPARDAQDNLMIGAPLLAARAA
jgi:hypothetical protein